MDFFRDRIFISRQRADVVDLPEESSAIDFALPFTPTSASTFLAAKSTASLLLFLKNLL